MQINQIRKIFCVMKFYNEKKNSEMDFQLNRFITFFNSCHNESEKICIFHFSDV